LFDGPFEWSASSRNTSLPPRSRSKKAADVCGAIAVGGRAREKRRRRTQVTLTMPVPPAGTFRYQVFAGPLDFTTCRSWVHGL